MLEPLLHRDVADWLLVHPTGLHTERRTAGHGEPGKKFVDERELDAAEREQGGTESVRYFWRFRGRAKQRYQQASVSALTEMEAEQPAGLEDWQMSLTHGALSHPVGTAVRGEGCVHISSRINIRSEPGAELMCSLLFAPKTELTLTLTASKRTFMEHQQMFLAVVADVLTSSLHAFDKPATRSEMHLMRSSRLRMLRQWKFGMPVWQIQLKDAFAAWKDYVSHFSPQALSGSDILVASIVETRQHSSSRGTGSMDRGNTGADGVHSTVQLKIKPLSREGLALLTNRALSQLLRAAGVPFDCCKIQQRDDSCRIRIFAASEPQMAAASRSSVDSKSAVQIAMHESGAGDGGAKEKAQRKVGAAGGKKSQIFVLYDIVEKSRDGAGAGASGRRSLPQTLVCVEGNRRKVVWRAPSSHEFFQELTGFDHTDTERGRGLVWVAEDHDWSSNCDVCIASGLGRLHELLKNTQEARGQLEDLFVRSRLGDAMCIHFGDLRVCGFVRACAGASACVPLWVWAWRVCNVHLR